MRQKHPKLLPLGTSAEYEMVILACYCSRYSSSQGEVPISSIVNKLGFPFTRWPPNNQSINQLHFTRLYLTHLTTYFWSHPSFPPKANHTREGAYFFHFKKTPYSRRLGWDLRVEWHGRRRLLRHNRIHCFNLFDGFEYFIFSKLENFTSSHYTRDNNGCPHH